MTFLNIKIAEIITLSAVHQIIALFFTNYLRCTKTKHLYSLCLLRHRALRLNLRLITSSELILIRSVAFKKTGAHLANIFAITLVILGSTKYDIKFTL